MVLKALLLMALYSIHSERQLVERIDADLLIRSFLDMTPQDDAFDATTRVRQRLASDEYRVSQRCRKKIEACFGWIKNIAGLARSRHVGRWKIVQQLEIAAGAYHLVRMQNLLAR